MVSIYNTYNYKYTSNTYNPDYINNNQMSRKIVWMTGDIIEVHDGELVTHCLISCMAMIWQFKDNNYLIHHSERQANVNHHPMVIVNKYIRDNNMTGLTIYVYSAMGFFDHEKEYFSDCFSDHHIEYKHYNAIPPNDELEIGLTKDGVLIDNIKPMK